jgi:N-acyl-D-aspartate/D-glutamate deacylase
MTLMPHEEKIAKLRDPAQREELRKEMDDFTMPIGLKIDFADAYVKRAGGANAALIGKRVGDIAGERGLHIADAIIEIALVDDLATSFGLEALGHSDTAKIARFLAEPLISIGAADQGAHVTNFSTYGDTGFLFNRYVREHESLSLEYAVFKLTHDAARIWGISDRGLIKPGYAADLVLFDPETIDRGPEIAVEDLPAPGFRYIRRARGIEQVFVNGARVYSSAGGYSDARAGAIVPQAA